MALPSLYLPIKQLHHALAALSGGLFVLRALALVGGMHWPRRAVVRRLTYVIDSALLLCALWLVHVLPPTLFANGWLWVKLVLVLTYIALGIAAFRPRRGAAARVALVVAALLCFVQVYGVARSHHPLGFLLWLLSA